MAIIYGLGQHAGMILNEYLIPLKEIEVIIDNNCIKETEKVMKWSSFILKRNLFSSKKIVIGSKVVYAEIKQSIIDSKLFGETSILLIDDWAKDFPRKEDYLGKTFFSQFAGNLPNFPACDESIPQQLLMNAKMFAERTLPLNFIPKGGIIAEIGVALGEFSEKMIEIIKPQLFYAVDIFGDKTKGFWGGNQFEDVGMTHKEYYCNKFKNLVQNNKMILKQGKSWEAIKEIPDDSLDYAYIDAGHDYSSVKKDIDAIYPKMKSGAILQFNDYTLHENYGIIPAVNEFVVSTNSEVVFYALATNEHNDIGIKINKR